MPYAYGATINHVFDTDHLDIYVTFRHPMQRSAIPQAEPPVYDWYPLPAVWLLEADEVPVDILSSEWLDEYTLFLTSDEVLVEPTGVTLEYAGPDEKLCTSWGKQWQPWGPKPSYAGYPTAPALHDSTHENGGADEINIAGLSGTPQILESGVTQSAMVEGTTDISTNSLDYVDMPDMSITLTTGANPVLIFFATGLISYDAPDFIGDFQLDIDGEKYPLCRTAGYYTTHVSGIYLKTLTAGEHTIKVQWKYNREWGEIYNYAATYPESVRRLLVVELKL